MVVYRQVDPQDQGCNMRPDVEKLVWEDYEADEALFDSQVRSVASQDVGVEALKWGHFFDVVQLYVCQPLTHGTIKLFWFDEDVVKLKFGEKKAKPFMYSCWSEK